MKTYKCVFFDLDDTLWDFKSNAKSSLRDVFFDFRLNEYYSDFEVFFNFYLEQNNKLWKLYGFGEITKEELQFQRFYNTLKHANVPNAELLQKQVGDRYLEILPTKNGLVPFAKELLDYLAGKYTLCIVSNGFVEVQYKKLQNTNIDKYFSHIILSEEAKALKPDKKIFEFALQKSKFNSAETIMIGDNYDSDIVGAINSNIDCILYDHQNKTIQNNNLPHLTVNSLQNITEFI